MWPGQGGGARFMGGGASLQLVGGLAETVLAAQVLDRHAGLHLT